MGVGWISIHRKIQENPIWASDEPFDDRSAWIDLLLLMNHVDKEIQVGRQIVEIRRGQHFTSIRKLALRWNWSKNKAMRYLNMLSGAGMILKENVCNGTLITVVKYEVYQGSWDTDEDTNEDTDETPMKTQRGQQRNTNNKYNNNIIMNNNENKEIAAPPADGGEWQ